MQANMTTHYLHSIIDENEELRLRVSKLQEIQKYMEALLKRCQQLEEEKGRFDMQMNSSIEQNSLLQKELKTIHEHHREQIKMVLLEHDAIMRQMQQELKVIRSQYERQSIISDELREGNHLKDNQLRLLQEKFKALTKQADHQISQLRQALLINEKEYQLLAEQHKMARSQFLSEKQELTKELYHLKVVVGREMKRHIEEIESQNLSLQKQTQGLRKYNQEIARNSTLREKQLAEQIKNLKIEFSNQKNQLDLQIEGLKSALNQKAQESSKRLNQSNILIDENIRLKRELQLSLSNENKFCFMLEESEKQNENLRQKLVEIDKYIKEETERYKQEFYEQRNHNNELRKVLSEKEMQMNQKLREIKDLLSIIDEIESGLKVKEKETGLLKNELETMEGQIKAHIKNYEEKNLQCRTLQQRNRSLKVSIEELQALNGSLKKQILDLETTNHSLKRELLNPRTSSKENEEKIQALIQSFRREKQIIYEQHQIEKSKMRQTHDFEIKQKQLQFLRKVEYFQQQLKKLT